MVRRRSSNHPGLAAVELAIVLPFLLLAFAACVDFARIFHTTQVIQGAAEAGARYAGGNAWFSESEQTRAKAATLGAVAEGTTLNPPLQADQVEVRVDGSVATVRVTYDFPLLTQVLIRNGSVRLQRTTIVRIVPRPGE